MCKKLIKALGTLAFLFVFISLSPLPAFAAQGAELAFTANIPTENGGFEYSFGLWQQEAASENRYFISMPYAVKGAQVTVSLTGAESAVFAGRTVSDGQVIDAPSRGTYTFSVNGTDCSLTVLYGSDIPCVYIYTDSKSMENVYADKNYKEPGEITILNGGKVEYSGRLKYIKGRGNSSWSQVKKPFNIKLDKKADILDMGEGSAWCLLANYVDVSLIKNKTALDFARQVGLYCTPRAEIVDLYIDDEYIGNYTLTEKIEIGKNRVDITDLEKLTEEANGGADLGGFDLCGVRGEESPTIHGGYKYVNIPANPRDITGGYLLEYELNYRYDDEVSGFVTNYGQPIILKSPEYASKAQVEYIRDYYQQFEDAVLSDDGYNSQGKHYTDYIDIQSMARMYVFQEYLKNLDAGITSFYLYKDAGGKFVASPVWDFDMAMGQLYKLGETELSDSYGFLATGRRIDNNGYTILSLLARRPEFRALAAQEWEQNFAPKVNRLIEHIDKTAVSVRDSALVDKNKWTEGFERSTAEVAVWHDDKVAELKDFMRMRASFMNDAFSSDNLYVYYCANGGEKAILDTGYYSAGDTVTLKENEFKYGEREFIGWNTKADGSGTEYIPGQTCTATDDIILYAQWEGETGLIQRIKSFIYRLFK